MMPGKRQDAWPYYAALLVLACVALRLLGLNIGPVYGVRLLFEPADIGLYFRSSHWVVDCGRLYLEVPSEYPPLANAIFAALRYLGNQLHSEQGGFSYRGFAYIWVITAGLAYTWAALRVATEGSWLATLAWVAPAPIYFALFRFDIY